MDFGDGKVKRLGLKKLVKDLGFSISSEYYKLWGQIGAKKFENSVSVLI